MYCSGVQRSKFMGYDLTTQIEIIARTSVHSDTEILEEILQIIEKKNIKKKNDKSCKSGISQQIVCKTQCVL